jgi:hypothetical protein
MTSDPAKKYSKECPLFRQFATGRIVSDFGNTAINRMLQQ